MAWVMFSVGCSPRHAQLSISCGMSFRDATSILTLAHAEHVKTIRETDGQIIELYQLPDGRQVSVHVIKKGSFISTLAVADPPLAGAKFCNVRSVSMDVTTNSLPVSDPDNGR